jgi:hypothetical protein
MGNERNRRKPPKKKLRSSELRNSDESEGTSDQASMKNMVDASSKLIMIANCNIYFSSCCFKMCNVILALNVNHTSDDVFKFLKFR